MEDRSISKARRGVFGDPIRNITLERSAGAHWEADRITMRLMTRERHQGGCGARIIWKNLQDGGVNFGIRDPDGVERTTSYRDIVNNPMKQKNLFAPFKDDVIMLAEVDCKVLGEDRQMYVIFSFIFSSGWELTITADQLIRVNGSYLSDGDAERPRSWAGFIVMPNHRGKMSDTIYDVTGLL